MRQTPPTPPEIDKRSPEPQQDDYVEVELAPRTAEPPRGGGKGFLWGCGGAVGCLAIFLIAIVGVIAVGVQSVADGFTGAFNLPPITIDWGEPAVIEVPDNVYIPPVERIRALSELTTTQYNYADVVTAQREMPAWLSTLYGDNVVMVVVGSIEAGIDISQITEDDIVFDETTQTMTITLPAPVLQSCFLDEGQSYVVDRDISPFAVPMDDLEDNLREFALRDYRDTAIEEGILLDAQAEAALSMAELLSILINDEEVTINITFADPIPDAPLPQSCQ